jgi:hypothetical protein
MSHGCKWSPGTETSTRRCAELSLPKTPLSRPGLWARCTHWAGRASLDRRQLVKQVRHPLIEAFGVKRVGQTQQLVVQMMAELVQ